MESIRKYSGKGTLLLKQIIALMIIVTFVIPQNLFANTPGDGDGERAPILSDERLDFNKLPEEFSSTEVNNIQTMNTTGTLNGLKVDIDLIRGEMKTEDSGKLVRALRHLEPQLKKAYESNPATKFQFIYIADEKEKTISLEAQEMLDLLVSINKDTSVSHNKVKSSTAKRFKEFLDNKVFDKTSKSDVWWSIARLVANGGSATYSLTVSNIPLPISIAVGVGVLGLGSASIGLFIEKYTGWLDHNVVDYSKGFRNRLGSVESYMFLSPLLIGLQSTGLNSLGGAALIAGTAAATTLVQNVYFEVKKRSPQAAMWYKWYATEALFITAPNLVLPLWDLTAKNAWDQVGSTFMFAAFSTISQGLWDVLLTSRRRPFLEAAIQKDLAEMAERLNGINISELTPKELDAITRKEEFKVREKYKPYYFAASFVSVLSAIAGNTGRGQQIPMLEVAGYIGLGFLTVSGVATWGFFKIKDRMPQVVNAIKAKFTRSRPQEVRSCSLLFSM